MKLNFGTQVYSSFIEVAKFTYDVYSYDARRTVENQALQTN